jgi:hypothetical protein
MSWDPSTTHEHLENDVLDDDLDVDASGDLTGLNAGDVLTWDYDYRSIYRVLSSDLADIDRLSISGRATPGTVFDVTLQLTGRGHTAIGPLHTFAGIPATIGGGAVQTIISEADNILGNLAGMDIADFHISVSVVSGTYEFEDAHFLWEARDIEALPEPSTGVLLGAGLLVCLIIFGAKRSCSAKTAND